MGSPPRKNSRLLRLIGLNLAIAAAYVVGKLLAKAPIAGGFSPVWPPTGVALASLVLFGREALPGVLAGCFSTFVTSGLPFLPSFGIGLGNFLEALLGAWILKSFGFRPTLARQRDVLLLCIPTAGLGAVLGATLGSFSLGLAPPHDWAGAFASWGGWCMEDLLGVLVVAPPILTAVARQRARDRAAPRPLEAALLATTSGLLGFFVFGGTLGDPALQFSLTYALFPLVLIAADRHGPRGAAFATLLTAASALVARHLGSGAMGQAEGRDYLILLAGFLALLALTALLLAAAGAERRERARELRGQTRLMELATESIGMSGLGGRMLRLNAAGRELFGIGPEQTLSTLRVVDLIAPEERPRFIKEILPRVLSHGSWSGDILVRNLKAGGAPIPTRQFLFRIDNPVDGEPESFGAIGHDLRESLRSEAALRQTQRLESLGVLAGGIAHDYNNLLTAVMGHLDLAREMVDPGHPAAPHLEAVTVLAERSGALTRQLLAYAGKGASVRERLDLRVLVSDMAELLRSSLSKKAEVSLDLGEGLPAVQGDPVQLEQVLMNLLMNASEALEDQAGSIRLLLRETRLEADEIARRFPGFEMAPGRFVALSVSDTGEGMGPEVLERIFDPFFTTKTLGRGLGLSALRGILQSHGGGVEVQSELGRGTTFTLVFPALEG